MKRKIAVVTGSRADYGLLYWLMKEIQKDGALALQLLVTGAHLSPRHGLTVRTIEADGFKTAAKIPILSGDDSDFGVTKALARAVEGFGQAFDRLKPDVVALLGDRYEMLAAAEAAMLARIPIAHLHGGEATEGLIDEAIRHSITKMAHYHFVSAEPYRRRVIGLGENPKNVFNFGAPGLDHLSRTHLLSLKELEKSLKIRLNAPIFLVTHHPVTLAAAGTEKALSALFGALGSFKGAAIVFTGSNADQKGLSVNRRILDFVKKNKGRAYFFQSLGQVRYLSLMKQAAVVVGNSSSGILEAPSFGVPTVNIGERQRGRLKDASVIDCAERKADIEKALKKALSPAFRAKTKKYHSVYGTGGKISVRIKDKLKSLPLGGILMKHFYEARGMR